MKLWIDDLRPAPEGWRWAKNLGEAYQEIDEAMDSVRWPKNWTDLALDHDLGGNETTIAFVNWLEHFDMWPVNRPTVHSMNPVGRKNLERIIQKKYGDDVCEIPL